MLTFEATVLGPVLRREQYHTWCCEQTRKGVHQPLNVEDDMTVANPMREPRRVELSTESPSPVTSRGSILLVEDDPSLAKLEFNWLTTQGYVVTLAENGELALNALHDTIPDLVLLDLDLPGTMNGWDVLKALRADTGTSTTPVLLTSAEAATQRYLHTHGETRSTLDHLPKPYPIPTLLKRIERMLGVTP